MIDRGEKDSGERVGKIFPSEIQENLTNVDRHRGNLLYSIDKSGRLRNVDLMEIVQDIFPSVLSEEQKRKKLSNLLQVMKKKDKTIDSQGRTTGTVWFRRG